MSTSTPQEKKTGQKQRLVLPARVKCEAVLSVWAERRKPSEVCRELGIKWATLNGWQNRALAAMISALEPREAQEQERTPALGPKLVRLLKKDIRDGLALGVQGTPTYVIDGQLYQGHIPPEVFTKVFK